jgi:DNA-binding transcriptional regulator GbsR (MarR family)
MDKRDEKDLIVESKAFLVKSAGRMSQDLGLGRIIGEVMAEVYLTEEPSSLDDIASNLGLSKAAVSIATRQLDKFSLLERIRKPGDRKTYYKVTEHFAASLQKGILGILRSKLQTGREVIDEAEDKLSLLPDSKDKEFLKKQLERAENIRKKVDMLVNNPLMRFIK